MSGYHPWWALEADGAGPAAAERDTVDPSGGAEPVWADYPFDVLDRLYVFEIEAAPDGELRDLHGWPEAWRPLVARASEAGVDVALTVTLHGEGAFEMLFGDPARTARLVERLVALVEASSPGLGGLQLDMEVFRAVPPPVRGGYSRFVAELRRRLAEAAPVVALSVFSPALDLDDAYDERALADAADYLVVQGYDLHHLRGARAGPLAGLDGWGRLNLRTVLDRYRSLGVPVSRIVLAVPLYGYEWPVEGDAPGATTRGEGVILPLADPGRVLGGDPTAGERVAEHGLRRDAESGSPWYAFDTGSGWTQGWFEDARSLAEKYEWVRREGLAGIALFPLAYGDDEVWEGVRKAFGR